MVGSAIAGILSGVGGTLITNIFNLFNTKEKNKQARLMADIRIKELKAESDANIQELEVQADIQKELAAQESFDISQKHGNKALLNSQMIEAMLQSKWWVVNWLGGLMVFCMGIIDLLRAAIRPGITIVLMYITGTITYQHLEIMNANKELVTPEMLVLIIESIIYLTFTVIGWWFGDRTIGKHFLKK